MTYKNSSERLSFLSNVVQKEIKHLRYTNRKLFKKPLTIEAVISFENSEELAETAEAFVSRFGRLQDTIGDKLLPLLLASKGEKTGPLVDNLDKAEKFGWLESADEWVIIRQLRNKMVHEYIEDPELLRDALNSGHQFVSALEKTANQLIKATKNLNTE